MIIPDDILNKRPYIIIELEQNTFYMNVLPFAFETYEAAENFVLSHLPTPDKELRIFKKVDPLIDEVNHA